MARKNKGSKSATTSRPLYPNDLSSRVLTSLTDNCLQGPETLLMIIQQLNASDGQLRLVSMLTGVSVSELQVHDPDLKIFKNILSRSLRNNPLDMLRLVSKIKEARKLATQYPELRDELGKVAAVANVDGPSNTIINQLFKDNE